MEMLHRIIGTALLLGAITTAGCVAVPEQDGDQTSRPNGRIVTTGLVGLPLDHKARIALSQAHPDTPDVPVEVLFKDAQGNVLARERGVIGARRPVIAELFRKGIETGGEVLIQTEIKLGPVQPLSGPVQTLSGPVQTLSGPVQPLSGTACPLHLTLQIVPGDGGNGPVLTCSGIDPCYDGDDDEGGGGTGTHGPGSGAGVFPACDSRPGTVSDDDDE